MNTSERTLQHFAEASTNYVRRMVEGREVRLKFDPLAHKKDMKGRLLAYVFLHDGTHVNAELIRHGFALVDYRQTTLEHKNEFRELEQEARNRGRGFWAPIR